MYHDGDILYQLEGLPGIWRECFVDADNRDNQMIVYVRLLGEGTEVFRPVPAIRVEDSKYILQGQEILESEEEDWEFAPGTMVITESRVLSGGTVLVATCEAK